MAKKIELEVGVKGGATVEKVVNQYSQLVKGIRAAKGELANFEPGTAGFKKASVALNELQEKLGDVQDTAKITGNGVERVSQSFNLFKESISTADFGKAKAAFTGLGTAMSAIPIFLLIEGLKYLYDNFDKVAEMLGFATNAAEEHEKAMEALAAQEKATADEAEKATKALQNQIDVLVLSKAPVEKIIELQKKKTDIEVEGIDRVIKRQKDAIAQTELQIKSNQAALQSAMLQAAGTSAGQLQMIEGQKNLLDAQLDAQKKELTALQQTETEKAAIIAKGEDEIRKLREANNEKRRENQAFINDKLKQLEYERYEEEINTTIELRTNRYNYDKEQLELAGAKNSKLIQLETEYFIDILRVAKEKEDKLAKLKYEATKKEFENKKASDEELEKLKADFDLSNIITTEKFSFQKRKRLRESAKLIEKDNIESAEAQEKIERDFNVRLLNEKLAFAQLKGEKVYQAERQVLLQKHSDELAEIEIQKKKELDIAEKTLQDKTAIEDKYTERIKVVKNKQYQEEIKLYDKTVEANKAANQKKLKDTLTFASQITAAFTQVSSSIIGVFQSLNEQEDYKRALSQTAIEESFDKNIDKIQTKRDDELAALDAYYKAQTEMGKAALDTQLADENLSAEEKDKLRTSAAEREKQLQIQLENDKLKTKYEADEAEYQANLAKFEAEENLKKEAFEADKKMKIAQITISTLTGAIAAFTGMLQSIPAPYGLIAGAIAAASVAAMGATQIATVSSTQYQKGKAPAAPKQPRYQVGGGASSGESPKTPTTPKDNTLYGTGGGGTPFGGSGMQQKQTVTIDQNTPIKTYVLTSDVSTALAAEEALKRKVTGF